MDRAIRWVKQEREKPFCLIFWFQSPHAPFFRPRRLLDLYNGIPIPKPATFDDDLKGYPGKPRAFANADDMHRHVHPALPDQGAIAPARWRKW